MKTHEEFLTWLDYKQACDESIGWVTANCYTAQEAWYNCHRGDWLLWWSKKENCDIQLLILAKGKCAETVIHLMTDQRSKDAVMAAIAFGNGEITREQLNAASADAAAAYTAADAAYAAYAAADAAADAADAADAAAYAAADAAYAAYAAADAAADAADAADAAAYAADDVKKAREENQKLTADIVRSIIKPTWL